MSKKQGVSEERLQCIFFLADDLIIRFKRLDSANLWSVDCNSTLKCILLYFFFGRKNVYCSKMSPFGLWVPQPH